MLRKAVYFIAATAAVVLASPMLPMELAVWFTGELLLYLEVVSSVWLASRFAKWRSGDGSIIRRVKARLRRLRMEIPRRWPSVESWLHGVVGFQ